jgi:toxin ParE1/3/4
MKIKWHRLARQDLRQVRAYIARDDPQAAAKIAQSIRSAIERLPDNPALGRPGRVIDTRELVVTGTPYLVPYTVVDDEIVVLRILHGILHGAQRWPAVGSQSRNNSVRSRNLRLTALRTLLSGSVSMRPLRGADTTTSARSTIWRPGGCCSPARDARPKSWTPSPTISRPTAAVARTSPRSGPKKVEKGYRL